MASEEKIQLRLDMSVPFEREFARAYRETSRSRRQEWMRQVLRLGLQALKASEQPGSAGMALLVGGAGGWSAARAPSPEPAPSQPAPAAAAAPSPLAAAQPTALPAEEPAIEAASGSDGESAEALKGFFPDIGG